MFLFPDIHSLFKNTPAHSFRSWQQIKAQWFRRTETKWLKETNCVSTARVEIFGGSQ